MSSGISRAVQFLNPRKKNKRKQKSVQFAPDTSLVEVVLISEESSSGEWEDEYSSTGSPYFEVPVINTSRIPIYGIRPHFWTPNFQQDSMHPSLPSRLLYEEIMSPDLHETLIDDVISEGSSISNGAGVIDTESLSEHGVDTEGSNSRGESASEESIDKGGSDDDIDKGDNDDWCDAVEQMKVEEEEIELQELIPKDTEIEQKHVFLEEDESINITDSDDGNVADIDEPSPEVEQKEPSKETDTQVSPESKYNLDHILLQLEVQDNSSSSNSKYDMALLPLDDEIVTPATYLEDSDSLTDVTPDRPWSSLSVKSNQMLSGVAYLLTEFDRRKKREMDAPGLVFDDYPDPPDPDTDPLLSDIELLEEALSAKESYKLDSGTLDLVRLALEGVETEHLRGSSRESTPSPPELSGSTPHHSESSPSTLSAVEVSSSSPLEDFEISPLSTISLVDSLDLILGRISSRSSHTLERSFSNAELASLDERAESPTISPLHEVVFSSEVEFISPDVTSIEDVGSTEEAYEKDEEADEEADEVDDNEVDKEEDTEERSPEEIKLVEAPVCEVLTTETPDFEDYSPFVDVEQEESQQIGTALQEQARQELTFLSFCKEVGILDQADTEVESSEATSSYKSVPTPLLMDHLWEDDEISSDILEIIAYGSDGSLCAAHSSASTPFLSDPSSLVSTPVHSGTSCPVCQSLDRFQNFTLLLASKSVQSEISDEVDERYRTVNVLTRPEERSPEGNESATRLGEDPVSEGDSNWMDEYFSKVEEQMKENKQDNVLSEDLPTAAESEICEHSAASEYEEKSEDFCDEVEYPANDLDTDYQEWCQLPPGLTLIPSLTAEPSRTPLTPLLSGLSWASIPSSREPTLSLSSGISRSPVRDSASETDEEDGTDRREPPGWYNRLRTSFSGFIARDPPQLTGEERVKEEKVEKEEEVEVQEEETSVEINTPLAEEMEDSGTGSSGDEEPATSGPGDAGSDDPNLADASADEGEEENQDDASDTEKNIEDAFFRDIDKVTIAILAKTLVNYVVQAAIVGQADALNELAEGTSTEVGTTPPTDSPEIHIGQIKTDSSNEEEAEDSSSGVDIPSSECDIPSSEGDMLLAQEDDPAAEQKISTAMENNEDVLTAMEDVLSGMDGVLLAIRRGSSAYQNISSTEEDDTSSVDNDISPSEEELLTPMSDITSAMEDFSRDIEKIQTQEVDDTDTRKPPGWYNRLRTSFSGLIGRDPPQLTGKVEKEEEEVSEDGTSEEVELLAPSSTDSSRQSVDEQDNNEEDTSSGDIYREGRELAHTEPDIDDRSSEGIEEIVEEETEFPAAGEAYTQTTFTPDSPLRPESIVSMDNMDLILRQFEDEMREFDGVSTGSTSGVGTSYSSSLFGENYEVGPFAYEGDEGEQYVARIEEIYIYRYDNGRLVPMVDEFLDGQESSEGVHEVPCRYRQLADSGEDSLEVPASCERETEDSGTGSSGDEEPATIGPGDAGSDDPNMADASADEDDLDDTSVAIAILAKTLATAVVKAIVVEQAEQPDAEETSTEDGIFISVEGSPRIDDGVDADDEAAQTSEPESLEPEEISGESRAEYLSLEPGSSEDQQEDVSSLLEQRYQGPDSIETPEEPGPPNTERSNGSGSSKTGETDHSGLSIISSPQVSPSAPTLSEIEDDDEEDDAILIAAAAEALVEEVVQIVTAATLQELISCKSGRSSALSMASAVSELFEDCIADDEFSYEAALVKLEDLTEALGEGNALFERNRNGQPGGLRDTLKVDPWARELLDDKEFDYIRKILENWGHFKIVF